MSAKTVSLDIQRGKGSTIDIARIFPLAQTRALELSRHGEFVDGIVSSIGPQSEIDISEGMVIALERFVTIRTLDIAMPDIVNPNRWQRGLLDMVPRPRRINLIPPLSIPYGSLDVRGYHPIGANLLDPNTPLRYSGTIHTKTGKIDALLASSVGAKCLYPDIFVRRLPYGLLGRRLVKGSATLYSQYRKKIALTLLGTIVLGIPMISYVAYALNHGYATLENLVASRDPTTIRSLIRTARGDFERANFLFTPFSWIPLSQIDTVNRASAGGLALTRGLDMVAQLLPETISASGAMVKKDTQDTISYRTAARDIFLTESLGIPRPTDWIAENQAILQKAAEEFTRAGNIYAGVVSTGERTIRMQKIGKTLEKLSLLLDWSLKNQKDILNMLGHANPQRYIVFNQNRDEIRANGGFPGSILSFTFYKGNIIGYHEDDVYYYDWNLYPYKEIPPPGIALLTDTYGLRDVNYYPDFHETLKKANNFIEKSGDATVTTGIAIHQGIIEAILAKIGPVSVPDIAVPFDEHNFSLLMSTLVENKYARENTPKDILFRFANAFVSKIVQNDNPQDILDILLRYVQDGEILFASRDADVDAFLGQYRKSLPWEIPTSNWIYPVWTSVSGNKSDRYMSRTYEAKTRKLAGCTYENTVTLQTSHTFQKSDADELQSYFKTFGITDSEEQAKLRFIQGNGKNRAFVRVYTPLGSTITSPGSDITVTQSEHATVFSLLMETPVGATTSKSWKYTLNIPNCASYDGQIEWTRQPGLKSLNVK